ncbi:hypothetical protein [Bradyrhizobium sp. AZCC 2289]|uniref:hypothetical protein n=1 Tax=Bradyrhizobium sp. AZCC 2289 TaxID=3117026 RepID=UPI002FF1AC5B
MHLIAPDGRTHNHERYNHPVPRAAVPFIGNGMPKRSIYPGYATFKSSNGYSRKTRSLNDASVALGQQIDLTQLRVPIFLLAAGKVVSADQLFATTRLVGTPVELLHTPRQ